MPLRMILSCLTNFRRIDIRATACAPTRDMYWKLRSLHNTGKNEVRHGENYRSKMGHTYFYTLVNIPLLHPFTVTRPLLEGHHCTSCVPTIISYICIIIKSLFVCALQPVCKLQRFIQLAVQMQYKNNLCKLLGIIKSSRIYSQFLFGFSFDMSITLYITIQYSKYI